MRWASFLPFLFLAAGAAAQGLPACGPAREGQVACVANRLCACRFERGGSLAGRPDRWDWDCGILRPDCAVPPADLPPADPAAPGLMVFPQVTLPPPPRPMPR